MSTNGDLWIIVFSGVVAISTIAYTIITVLLWKEQVRLRRAQTDPCVVIYPRHHKTEGTVLELVVENIGLGVAYNVEFDGCDQLPSRAFGVTQDNCAEFQPFTEGPFVSGIPALAPRDTRVVIWGQWGGISKHVDSKGVVVTARFSSSPNGKPLLTTQNPIEIESFYGLSVGKNPEKSIADSMERMQKDLAGIASEFKKPRIIIQNQPGRDESSTT